MNTLQLLDLLLKYKIKVQPFPTLGVQNLGGLCCKSKKIIYINEDMSDYSKLETLMHELVHAYEYELVNFDHNEEKVEKEAQRLIKHGIPGIIKRKKTRKAK